MLGLTFKENCEDLRNSRVIDVIRELETYGIEVLVYDPVANAVDAKEEYGVELVDFDRLSGLDAVIAAVAHDELVNMAVSELAAKSAAGAPFIDIKSSYDRDELAGAGFSVWRL
jgi:UDP-N-acetyl-D-galactosamine dehydrogenase